MAKRLTFVLDSSSSPRILNSLWPARPPGGLTLGHGQRKVEFLPLRTNLSAPARQSIISAAGQPSLNLRRRDRDRLPACQPVARTREYNLAQRIRTLFGAEGAQPRAGLAPADDCRLTVDQAAARPGPNAQALRRRPGPAPESARRVNQGDRK